MRRQIRPFTVERKRAGRNVPAAEAPLLDLPAPPAPPPAPATGAPRWAAAEALFAVPVAEPGLASGGAQDRPGSTGRILQSLIEPPAPQPSYPEDAPKRRGRKPGSRNKAREPVQGPRPIENVMRNLFEFWAKEDGADEAPAPDTTIAAPAAPSVPLALRRRGRVERSELPRGQRWKARLPRFAR